MTERTLHRRRPAVATAKGTKTKFRHPPFPGRRLGAFRDPPRRPRAISYNGIGLQTARGSGTNGYVQGNKFHRSASRLQRQEWKDLKTIHGSGAQGSRRPDEAILEHNRKREIEAKLMQLEDDLGGAGSERGGDRREAQGGARFERESERKKSAGGRCARGILPRAARRRPDAIPRR